MDHNIEDTLTLESDMGSMDFDHSDVVVNQDDITLEDSSQPNISMDLEHIEDQSALMDTGGEEVIISDFMSDQFSFQEYTVQSNNTNDGMIKLDQNQLNVLLSQNEAFNVQLTNSVSSVPSVSSNTEVTTTKGTPGPKPAPKKATAPFPRQVAIAPKPANVPNVQYAIAPKPVALVMNKSAGASVSKKVTIGNIQGNIKANTVLTQIGKQIVMVPTNTAGPRHKIKVIPASSSESGVHFAQIISNKSGAKPVMTKLLVQGQPNQESPNQGQPAVITKLLPVSAANQLNRAKVIITTPTKQNLFKKQQFFAIKTQNPTKVPTTQGNFTTKRVVITSNQSQNVLMKAAASKNVAQVFKDKPVIPSQHTQLHKINVPGKGIQYIKLVTSQAPAQKPKPATPLAVPAKNFVLTDSKGNIIQMAAEKVTSQSTPLMVTGLGANKLQKKLVRIAPMSSKSGTQGMLSVRSSQSLLAPLSVGPTEGTSPAADYTLDHDNVPETNAAEQVIVDKPQHTDKPTLQSIISDAIGDSEECIKMESMENVECVYDSKPMHEKITFMVDEDERNNINQDNSISKKQEESPIIIIPATNYTNQSEDHEESMYSNDTQHMEDSKQNLSLMSMNVEAEVVPYNMSPGSPNEFNDSEVVSSDLGLRPRKACNCTKSQCLKLYCDCFANGEFCNNCNCNNCHNNLQNEELRQKAIRSCLERNPNAFRPKIGKAKAGGPEIIRRHNKGCNCKRSGCLKNYCECYEAKIACTTMCKCVGCRNVEETLDRRRGAMRLREKLTDSTFRPPPAGQVKQPSSFMTVEVIEAVCQCLVAAAAEGGERAEPDAVHDVIEEFARCLQDIIGASHHAL